MVMLMFFDREYELKALEKAYISDRAELIVIYGRRRLGKTRLVQEFLRKRGGIYLFTPRGSIKDVLNAYSYDIREQTGEYVSFADWRDFLDYLNYTGKKRRAIVIDEFQRLSKAYQPAITMLQDQWDKSLERTKIKLILVGSAIGMIERIALLKDAPLFGRKTRELRITSIPYIIMRKYWNTDEETRIHLFGVFGGTPGYFTMVNKNRDIYENIKELILDPEGTLSRAPEQLLAEETRSPSTYLSILASIARSGRGLALSKIHVRKGSPTVYLRNLIKMDIVEKLKSLAQGDIIYVIKDEFFRFWFTHIYPRLALIEMRRGDLLLKMIREKMDEYISFTFEKILRELITMMSGKEIMGISLPAIDNIGAYWRKNIEIDACATAKEMAIFGEAKWISRKITRRDIEKFTAKAEIATKDLKKKDWIGIYLARSGFSSDAKKLESKKLLLLDLEELGNVMDKFNV